MKTTDVKLSQPQALKTETDPENRNWDEKIRSQKNGYENLGVLTLHCTFTWVSFFFFFYLLQYTEMTDMQSERILFSSGNRNCGRLLWIMETGTYFLKENACPIPELR